jgi:Bacteriocin-protection, YdeI or OmpD-Associated
MAHRMVPELCLTSYRGCVSSAPVPGWVVHKLPADLRQALSGNPTALDAWRDITPLARNEFICWVEDAKQEKTRERRIRRTQEELEEGMRRPCCWPGCAHRERTGR